MIFANDGIVLKAWEFGLTKTTFDDYQISATLVRVGALSKPDFDYTNLGLLFPQNDATEIAYMICQFSHNRKGGTNLRPHVHFVQSSALTPTFKISYRWYENGADPTVGFTIITTNAFVFTYTAGSILQVAKFPAIDGSSYTGVSSFLDIKLYREDNVAIGDVLVKNFDIHYEIDSLGSKSERAK